MPLRKLAEDNLFGEHSHCAEMPHGVARRLSYLISQASCCPTFLAIATEDLNSGILPHLTCSFWFNGGPEQSRYECQFFDHCREEMMSSFKTLTAHSIGKKKSASQDESSATQSKAMLSINSDILSDYMEAGFGTEPDDGSSKEELEIDKIYCHGTRASSAHMLSFFTSFCFQEDSYCQTKLVCFPFCQLPLNHRTVDENFINGTENAPGLLDLFARNKYISGSFTKYDQSGHLLLSSVSDSVSKEPVKNNEAVFLTSMISKPTRGPVRGSPEIYSGEAEPMKDKPCAKQVSLHNIHYFYEILSVS